MMRIYSVIIAIFLIIVSAETMQAQGEHENLQATYQSIYQIQCNSRSATGFLVKDISVGEDKRNGIVTALHAVADCGSIEATSDNIFLSDNRVYLQLFAVDVDHDVALLVPEVSSNSLSEQEGLTTTQVISENMDIYVVGHPYGRLDTVQTKMIVRTKPTLRAFFGKDKDFDEEIKQLETRKSPNLDLDILDIQGALVPGYSGAPIFNNKNQVIGVANGTLLKGATDYSWAIPWLDIRWTAINKDETCDPLNVHQQLACLKGMDPGKVLTFVESTSRELPKDMLRLEINISQGEKLTSVVQPVSIKEQASYLLLIPPGTNLTNSIITILNQDSSKHEVLASGKLENVMSTLSSYGCDYEFRLENQASSLLLTVSPVLHLDSGPSLVIQGCVYDLATHRPISEATIKVYLVSFPGQALTTVRTTSDGHFVLPGIIPDYKGFPGIISVEAEGYLFVSKSIPLDDWFTSTLYLEKISATQTLTFTPTPSATSTPNLSVATSTSTPTFTSAATNIPTQTPTPSRASSIGVCAIKLRVLDAQTRTAIEGATVTFTYHSSTKSDISNLDGYAAVTFSCNEAFPTVSIDVSLESYTSVVGKEIEFTGDERIFLTRNIITPTPTSTFTPTFTPVPPTNTPTPTLMPTPTPENFALEFDGKDDYINVSSVNNYGANILTYVAKIKPYSVDGWRAIILHGSANAGVNFGLYNGHVWVGGKSKDTDWQNAFIGNIQQNEWANVVATYDEATHLITVYINGQLLGATNQPFTIDGFDFETMIGRNQWSDSVRQYFAGQIDYVAIWGRALSQSQIVDLLVRAPDEVERTDLIAFWSFSEGLGAFTYDETKHLQGFLGGGSSNKSPLWLPVVVSSASYVPGTDIITPTPTFASTNTPTATFASTLKSTPQPADSPPTEGWIVGKPIICRSDKNGAAYYPVSRTIQDNDESKLAGFWFQQTRVNKGQYWGCKKCPTPEGIQLGSDQIDDHITVTHETASEYATWLGGRLPTEAEWRVACDLDIPGFGRDLHPDMDQPFIPEFVSDLNSDGSMSVKGIGPDCSSPTVPVSPEEKYPFRIVLEECRALDFTPTSTPVPSPPSTPQSAAQTTRCYVGSTQPLAVATSTAYRLSNAALAIDSKPISSTSYSLSGVVRPVTVSEPVTSTTYRLIPGFWCAN